MNTFNIRLCYALARTDKMPRPKMTDAEKAAREGRKQQFRDESRMLRLVNIQPAPPGDMPPMPDPASPDAIKALFSAFYGRMWRAAHATLTMQDVTAGFNASRLAAGIGKRDEATSKDAIPMESLLGGGSKVSKPSGKVPTDDDTSE